MKGIARALPLYIHAIGAFMFAVAIYTKNPDYGFGRWMSLVCLLAGIFLVQIGAYLSDKENQEPKRLKEAADLIDRLTAERDRLLRENEVMKEIERRRKSGDNTYSDVTP